MSSEGRESLFVPNKPHVSNLLSLRSSNTTFSVNGLVHEFITYETEVLQHSKTTIITHRSHLKTFNEFCIVNELTDIRDLSNLFMDRYFVHYSQDHSKTTLNTDKRIMKVFLRWVSEYKEGIYVHAKADSIRSVKVRNRPPQAIDDDITKQVIREVKRDQDRLIIATFREGGLRISELVQLKVSDVLGDQLQVHGKGQVDRNVQITPQLSKALKKFASSSGRYGGDWLFQNKFKGEWMQMTIKTVRKRVQDAYMLIAGIKMNPHQLRHSMAVGLLIEGCDLVTIQKQLGHEYITTTQEYLRLDDSHLRVAYGKAMPNSFLSY